MASASSAVPEHTSCCFHSSSVLSLIAEAVASNSEVLLWRRPLPPVTARDGPSTCLCARRHRHSTHRCRFGTGAKKPAPCVPRGSLARCTHGQSSAQMLQLWPGGWGGTAGPAWSCEHNTATGTCWSDGRSDACCSRHEATRTDVTGVSAFPPNPVNSINIHLGQCDVHFFFVL